jgi:nucleoside-diphosphate-sugar epimerase
MRILLTGARGFLGKSISEYFQQYHSLETIGRKSDCHYSCDLANEVPVLSSDFDVVIHAAGKAHIVPKTQKEADDFFKVNHHGTKNLLQALENQRLSAFIFISTVAVYGLQSGNNITETYPLNATDPYGKSKIMAEIAVAEWCSAHNIPCTILRLPLLIGLDAPGNLNSMVNGIKRGIYFNVSKGTAKKSMVLVSDIPIAIKNAIGKSGIFNITDGYHPSLKELSTLISRQLNRRIYNIPYCIAKSIAKIGDLIGNKAPLNTNKLMKITLDLTFDDSKARQTFGWKPTPVLEGFNL